MYKIISILAFLLFLTQTFSFAANANMNFDLDEEEYVDDIPFNTNTMIGFDLDTNKDSKISSPNFEVRQKMMVVSSILNINFEMKDEEYINDIPFNTESIVNNDPIYLNTAFNKVLNVDFQMEEESYIDDIPFNTSDVIRKLKP